MSISCFVKITLVPVVVCSGPFNVSPQVYQVFFATNRRQNDGDSLHANGCARQLNRPCQITHLHVK